MTKNEARKQDFDGFRNKSLALARGELDLDEHDHDASAGYVEAPTSATPKEVLQGLFDLPTKNGWALIRRNPGQ